jgi:DNA-binding GntR family transcriptional regulator
VLAAILEQMDDVLRTSTHERWGDLNEQFHLAIAGVTGMPMLHDMTERALRQWGRIRRYFFADVLEHRLVRSQQEHHAMLEALQRRDTPTLEWLVRAHNQGALAAYMDHLVAQPAPTIAGADRSRPENHAGGQTSDALARPRTGLKRGALTL